MFLGRAIKVVRMIPTARSLASECCLDWVGKVCKLKSIHLGSFWIGPATYDYES